ncbi:MAG TPA: protein-tyrosine phosphatase family protein [Pseudonocardiaceae bacterium]
MSDQLAGSIMLPDGTPVRGRGLRAPLPPGPLPSYGLYLSRLGRLGRPRWPWRGQGWRPDWPAEWIDWPDFRIPGDGPTAAAAITHAYRLARAGERVEVACAGGTGRTGTVIACMAILAGHSAEDAVGWTRRYYRPRAVETPGQQRWIARFAAGLGP